jgi:signal transduction histidine kinase
MKAARSERWRWITGLSGRLLALTAGFVMLAEVLVFVPSISRFRLDYLDDRLSKAHIAILALEATADKRVDETLERQLLFHAGAYAIVLKSPERRMLMLSRDLPPRIDATFDLAGESLLNWIGDAMRALVRDGDRVIRVVGPSPRDPGTVIEVVLDERPMQVAMRHFSWRILALSLIISFITACLVYLALQWLMVRPIRQLTDSIIRFRDSPEDAATTINPAARADEIGLAQRELAAMQRDLRGALHQKTRLAALGTAVAKINHDLKNTLSTAVLASDRLASIDEPEVRRLAPRLVDAIDRAVALCGRTLEFARSDQPALADTRFDLATLLAEVEDGLRLAGPGGGGGSSGPPLQVDAHGCHVQLLGDRQQLFRVFSNLALNAGQAGARRVRVSVHRADGAVDAPLHVDVSDDGPGIPEKAIARLFQPFATSGRNGGSGLGLVIAREIVEAHGGRLDLHATGPAGTTFRVTLPARRVVLPRAATTGR